jgi:CIC family chloride channel protein
MTFPFRSPTQLRLREQQLFLALSIVIGVLAGLAAVLFALGIDLSTRLFFGLSPSNVRLFGVPVLVSLVSGVLLAKVFPDARGSGLPQTKAAYQLHGGVIRSRVPIGKFLTGILCIGSGHSMGPEGPSVQIGAGIASGIGRWLGLSPERAKALVPVGAAGALAAAFNTPVAAVIFALEEIIGDLNATLIGSTVIASVAAVIVERSILGNAPLFRVPVYHFEHPAELIGYAVLGVIGGFVSLLFCKSLLWLRAAFRRLPDRTRWLQPAMGGVAIGVLAIVASPSIMGVGYEYVDQALHSGIVFRMLLLLCFVKLAATVISMSSGNAGGIFAPSLYIGAMAGGVVGTLVHRLALFPSGDPGAYALVGMGTLFAGIIRAPMTSVFMIFEITQDYEILVPLMVANLLAFAISRRFQPTPVIHALLEQDHVHLPAPGHRTGSGAWLARDVMGGPSRFVSPAEPIERVWQTRDDDRRPWLVGDAADLQGVVRLEQLAEAMEHGRGRDAVSTVMDAAFNHAHADQPIDVVLERLAGSGGLLPVVSREDTRRVEGVITFEDVSRMLRRGGKGAHV